MNRIFLLFLSVLLIQGTQRAQARADLDLGLRTDYVPGVEAVRAFVAGLDGQGRFVQANFLILPQMDLIQGENIGTFEDFGAGVALLRLHLWDRHDRFLGSHELRFRMREASGAVIFTVARPQGTAQKFGELFDDRDGDGAISNGDIVRYTVEVEGNMDHFEDLLSEDLQLVAGSVTTTEGEVVRGNTEEDTSIRVDGGCCFTTIQYNAVVRAHARNQGLAVLEDSGNFAYLDTDDPYTEEPGDATLLPVQCSAQDVNGDLVACAADRDRLADELATCGTERRALRTELDQILADPDRDGVPAISDQCPNTPRTLGEAIVVDGFGCSQAEFCSGIVLSKSDPLELCHQADWNHDEPGANPEDCRVELSRTCVSSGAR